MAVSFASLRGMSKEDLITQYDQLSRSRDPHLDFYLNEIARRELQEQNQIMLTLTQEMRNMTGDVRKWTMIMIWLTGIITVLTIINVWAVIFKQ